MSKLLLVVALIIILVGLIAFSFVFSRKRKDDSNTTIGGAPPPPSRKRVKPLKKEEFVIGGNQESGLQSAQKAIDGARKPILEKPIGWVQTAEYQEDALKAPTQAFLPEQEKKGDVSTSKKYQVLAVDDSMTVLKYLDNLLNKEYELVLKLDGDQALDYLNQAETPPSILLTDLEMPNLHGAELVKRVRANNRFKRLPIIVISSNPAPYLDLLSNGLVNGMMSKPFDKNDLKQQIRYLVKG